MVEPERPNMNVKPILKKVKVTISDSSSAFKEKRGSISTQRRSMTPESGESSSKLVSIDDWSLVKITAATMDYLAKFT